MPMNLDSPQIVTKDLIYISVRSNFVGNLCFSYSLGVSKEKKNLQFCLFNLFW